MISTALPETAVTAADLDQIYAKLASLEIAIVDPSEVDRVKTTGGGRGGEGQGTAGHPG